MHNCMRVNTQTVRVPKANSYVQKEQNRLVQCGVGEI